PDNSSTTSIFPSCLPWAASAAPACANKGRGRAPAVTPTPYMPAFKRSRRESFENEKFLVMAFAPLIQLVLGLTHDQVQDQSQRVLKVRLRNGDVGGAQLIVQEGDEFLARFIAGGNSHEAMNQVVDHLCGVLQVLAQNHAGQIDLRRVARNRLDSLDGHLGTAETAIARGEILV